MAGIFDTGIFDRGIFDHTADAGAIPSVNPITYGSGGTKKKKPKKAEIVEEVVQEVVQAIPQPAHQDESRAIALRLATEMTIRQLQETQTIDRLIARVEVELAEMDDEEILLLAA